MPRSFADLEKDPNVRAMEVAAVLSHYAYSGAAISAGVVTDLIDRTNPDNAQRLEMRRAAYQGRISQSRRGFPQEAEEYTNVREKHGKYKTIWIY